MLEEIPIDKISIGPLKHETLSDDHIARIKQIYDICGQFVGETLEQWEIGFMRDSDPEREILVWEQMASRLKTFTANVKPTHARLKKAYESLLLISLGVTDPIKLPSSHADLHRLLTNTY